MTVNEQKQHRRMNDMRFVLWENGARVIMACYKVRDVAYVNHKATMVEVTRGVKDGPKLWMRDERERRVTTKDRMRQPCRRSQLR